MAKRKRSSDVASTHAAAPVTALRLFRVSLELEETLQMDAADRDEAWEKYKQARGIVDSDHVPQIVEISA